MAYVPHLHLPKVKPMTTTELNAKLADRVNKLVSNGGLAGDDTNRAFLLGGVMSEWLVQNGWRNEEPGFWNHADHPAHFVITDTREAVLMERNELTEDLEVVDAFPQAVA